MLHTILSRLRTTARKPGGLIMSLLIAAALVSPVVMLMAGASTVAVNAKTASTAEVYYVTPDGTGDGSGSSWASAMSKAAFIAKMDAISADTSLDVTFYMGKGRYDLTRTLPLTKGVKVYGGFNGTETAPDQRDIKSIMSGDNAMNAEQATILSRDASVGDDVHFCIVTGGKGAASADTVLDGVTATGGNGTKINNYDYYYGGGMYNYDSSPTVANCTFIGNSANYGGAMYSIYYSSPTVTNCSFIINKAASSGGAMGNNNYSSPTVASCSFINNTAGGGGAVYNQGSSPSVTSCTFNGNISTGNGGGAVYNQGSSPVVMNCSFINNSADGRGSYGGGAMFNNGSSPIVTNCTFSGNAATDAGGMGGAMYSRDGSSPVVCNSLFWDNLNKNRVSEDIYINISNEDIKPSSLDIRSSIVQMPISGDVSGVTSTDIISGAPGLIPLGSDLQKLTGSYASTDVYIYAIPKDSPAVRRGLVVGSTVSGDVKVPATDQTGLMRQTAVSTDLGAYSLNIDENGASLLTISPASLELAVGNTAALTLSSALSPGLQKQCTAAAWSSSAAGVASAAGDGISAVITAVKAGTATITANFTLSIGPRLANGTEKTELTGTSTSVVTVTATGDEPVSPDNPVSPDKPVHKGGSGCNASTAGSGIALLALCLPMLIKRRKR